ncbi:MAG TPA: RNA 2',3'-cyclic phosphodiesterase [Ktedonobacterales bacterium]
MTRVFIALDLSDAAREALDRDLRRLARALPAARLSDPASLHLTLAFLGEVDDATLAAVIAATGEVTRATAPFELALAKLGVFGPREAPRVIWAGVGGDLPPLRALQRRLTDALEPLGFPHETRPFSPHLTLARLKQPLTLGGTRRLAALLAARPPAPTRWQVAEAHVMRSDLAATVARYSILSVAPFAGASE